MNRLTLALAAQAITCLVGVLGSSFIVGISIFNIMLFLSIFAPIPIGLYYAVWNKHRRGLVLVVGVLFVAAGLFFGRLTSVELRRIAKERGDQILTSLQMFNEREGRPALRLELLEPNYIAELPSSPYLFSHYYLIDTNEVQFDAPAFMQCRKAVGGEWECDD